MKPMVYLAAFESGLGLDTMVPDEPIEVPLGSGGGLKWISNYDNQFKGPIPVRQALAESRNAVAVWIATEIGLNNVIQTAHLMGIRTPLQPYISTALGASEVHLLELADTYRAIASGVLAEPHVIARVTDVSGAGLYEGAAVRPGNKLPGIALDPRGTPRRGSSPRRYRAQPRHQRLSDPGPGQDRDDERFPRCAVRGLHLWANGNHRGGPDRLR
jgi:penicillin-binding protein 1A